MNSRLKRVCAGHYELDGHRIDRWQSDQGSNYLWSVWEPEHGSVLNDYRTLKEAKNYVLGKRSSV